MGKNKAKNNKNNGNKNNQFTKNLLICGDNMKALDDLKKQGIKEENIEVTYRNVTFKIEPPF